MLHLAYLSLGSNVGDREANLSEALRLLRGLGEITAKSSLYETEPVEVVDQPWFLNAAVALRTRLEPSDLLREILGIEKAMGRVRTQPKGPRTIDIDILLYGSLIVTLPGLTIPHPGMHERMFVLAPLAEIAPEVLHPGLRRKIAELERELAVGGQLARRMDAPWSSSG